MSDDRSIGGVNPAAMMSFMSISVLGDMKDTDALPPMDEQYAIVPGDYAVLAASTSVLDTVLHILEVLNPEDYKVMWPDWEERVHNSFLLCRWIASNDASGDIGWFSRVKMIRLDEEQHETIAGWFETGLPEDPPAWLMERYGVFTNGLHEQAPDVVPVPTECGSCGKTGTVKLRVKHITEFQADCGTLTRDGAEHYAPMSNEEHRCGSEAYLHCTDCHATMDMEGRDLAINEGSMLRSVFEHHHRD